MTDPTGAVPTASDPASEQTTAQTGSTVLVRYWAGAKAAAGVAEEQVTASTLASLLDTLQAGRDANFAKVLRLCSLVVSERPVPPEQRESFALHHNDVVDVLPPFAGGSHPA